ncbi:MAG: transposase, partial [Desulfobacterales bacterium]|nr:transposase [Desulfobacterales bacterium]
MIQHCGHSALMGRKKRPWQDVGYVPGYFGRTTNRARKAYFKYLGAGIDQGRQDELTGGGLI